VLLVVKKGSNSLLTFSLGYPRPNRRADLDPLPVRGQGVGDGELAALRHGLAGVEHQIPENLLDLVAVELDRRQAGVQFLDDADVLERRLFSRSWVVRSMSSLMLVWAFCAGSAGRIPAGP